MNHFSNKEQQVLISKWKNQGSRAALNLMISSNLNLVRKEAMKLSKVNPGISEEDLIQEGLMGLNTAIDKYDAKKCSVFIPYALLWIRKNMRRYVINNRSIVRLGTTNDSRKIFSSMSRVIDSAGLDNATEEEKVKAISSDLGVSREDVCQIRNILSKNDKSIDVFVESRDRELLENGSDVNEYEDIELSELLRVFRNNIEMIMNDRLTEEDRCIIEGRFLMDDIVPLQEIAKKLKITHQAVKYREQKILLALKKSLESDFGMNKYSFFDK